MHFVPSDSNTPRKVRFVLTGQKTDIEGTGPSDSLENFIPCICMEDLTGNSKRSFGRQIKRNSDVACLSAYCPYNIIKKYYGLCSDPSGIEKENLIKKEGSGKPLHFMRAKVTSNSGDYYGVGPSGINTLAQINKKWNDR